MCNHNACTAKDTNFRKGGKVLVRLSLMVKNEIKVNGASYLKHTRDDLTPAVEAMYPNKDFIFVQDNAQLNRADQVQNVLKQKLTLIGLQNCLIATLYITTFGTTFKRKYTMFAIFILL